MANRHSLAVKARIEQVPKFAVRTFRGVAGKDAQGKLPAPPYVVMYSGAGTDTADRLTGPRSTQHPRWTLQIVGLTEESVQENTELVKAQFHDAYGFGVPPEVAGDRTSALTWSEPQEVQWDTDVSPRTAYQTVELGFKAEPI